MFHQPTPEIEVVSYFALLCATFVGLSKQIRRLSRKIDTKPDEDGHREKAIDYTNKAIEELIKALAGTE